MFMPKIRCNRNGRLPAREFGLLFLAGCLIVMLAAPSVAEASVVCDRKFDKIFAVNKKENTELMRKIKAANNANMYKTDPVKYCDWHKKNVQSWLLVSLRRWEVMANDAECYNDIIAVSTYERMAANYKSDQRWLSGMCLGLILP
jgi:hypothetical protein